VGISNDIVAKRMPAQIPEHGKLHKTNDVVDDFDVKQSSSADIDAHEEEPKQFHEIDSKHDNSALADEFFNSSFSKGPKNNQSKMEKPKVIDQPNSKFNLLNTRFLWSIFVILVLILCWQNYASIKNIFIEEEPEASTQTTTQSSSTQTPSDSNPVAAETKTIVQSTVPTESTVPTSDAAATQTPPTTTTVIDKSTISIKVLNGNGVAGRAAKVSSLLTTDGYKVLSTGNAKRFTYATTIVYFHEGKAAEANLVKETLNDYSVSLQQDNTIANKSDIVVVVGKK